MDALFDASERMITCVRNKHTTTHDTRRHMPSGNGSDTDTMGTRHGHNRLGGVLPVIGIIVGLVLLVTPVVLDAWSSWKDSQAISSMSSVSDDADDPERLEQLAQAQAYNEQLGTGHQDIVGAVAPYQEQLTYKSDPMMGWIEVPSANIKTPIYHGTTDSSLSAGAGHLEQTSLPVGGSTSHCVLTGHSGMQGQRMFDDLRNVSVVYSRLSILC